MQIADRMWFVPLHTEDVEGLWILDIALDFGFFAIAHQERKAGLVYK